MHNRQLVACAVQRHLTALKLPLRPVIFHPNLRAAMDQVDKVGLLDAWNAASDWGAAEAARAVCWGATWAVWDVAWATLREAGRAARAAGEVAWSVSKASPSGTAVLRLRPSELVEVIGPSRAWAAMMGITRGISDDWETWRDSLQLSSHPLANYRFFEAARTFLQILRGGVLFLWIAPEVVHVVLATIRTHEWAPSRPEWQKRFRLHCEDAPAIQYEDGSALYFWKGIQVPERVILYPSEMRVEEILQERNAEVRRAMIERYGQDRFILDAGAQQIDKWKDNELLSIDLPDDRDRRMVALKLRCPSTAAVYIIRVPPDQCTVQGALAWSFGLRPGQYFLQEES